MYCLVGRLIDRVDGGSGAVKEDGNEMGIPLANHTWTLQTLSVYRL